ncbi:hypothetical protein ACL03H_09860 [Saccharopolyspora sp. MS10]|uniref:hypothetical protein n=1 Tax=Saccharopolyspora sp. MS10 TaxID=3385973 RepID=UPI00399F269D
MSGLVAPTIMAAVIVAVIRAAKRRPSRRARGRRPAVLLVGALVAIQALIGAPASAQGLDCKEAPNPERPGSGMVGAIDPAPLGSGQPGSAYDEVAYAGTVWNTYDLGCGPQGVTNPNALVDTWLGNELFNVAKNLVGATNGLHYALLNGELMGPLDDLIATGTVALYDSVFTPWFGVAALVLAVLLFRYIWQGDLAAIGKRTMWALAGLWFASATYLTPMIYTHALDEIVITGTSAVQAGFLQQVGVDEANTLPTVLHDQVVYRNWLRGEFGSPDTPQANELGRELLRAQAWTKQEVAAGADAGSPEPKKQAFENVAGRMGSAYGYFQGLDGSRVGAAMLALVQSLAFASFQLMAKAAILLAQVLLRVLILAGPLIGLVALLNHQILRAVGRVAGAAMLNVLVIAAMAGLHTWVLAWIFNPLRAFPVLTQILLAGLVTIVFIMVGKPVRRMGQMVQLSIGGTGGVAQASRGVFGRMRGRGSAEDPSGQFWDQVRESDPDAPPPDPAGRRGSGQTRPEAEHQTVSASAQRMDRQSMPWTALPGSAAPTSAGGAGSPALPGSGPAEVRRPGGPAAALPEGRPSRVVNTAPVVDAPWDRREEDPVLVPSRTDVAAMPAAEPMAPRRADMEVVAGKPVHVVYRPSRGLEVADEDY